MPRVFDAEAATQIAAGDIECGWWLGRHDLKRPQLACMIRLVDHEPGEPDNPMDRAGVCGPPYHEAEIDGAICSVYEVLSLKDRQPISEVDYQFRIADRAWAAEWAPSDKAALNPRRRADLTKVDPIF